MNDIKIDKIIINGFKEESKIISIEMSKNKTTHIYGPNGYGKTTLLNIIYALFNRDEDKLLIENVKNIEIIYSDEDKHEIEIYREYEDANKNYDWNEFNNSKLSKLKLLYITTERGLSNGRRKLNQEDINIFFNQNGNLNLNLNSSYKEIDKLLNFLNGKSEEVILDDVKKNKNIFIQNINMTVLENFMIQMDKENKKNEALKKMNMKNKLLIHTLDTYKNVTEDFKKNSFINYKYTETLLDEDINILKEMTKESYDLITGLIEINSEASNNYLKYLKESIKEYKFIKDSKSKVKEYFFNIVKKELIIGSDNVYVKVNGKNHTLDKLSHGERQLITFLVFLDYVGKKKDLILIDEPCISLDTDWQEKLVSIFSSICPNSEFILTTHSPYLSINHMKSIRNIDILE